MPHTGKSTCKKKLQNDLKGKSNKLEHAPHGQINLQKKLQNDLKGKINLKKTLTKMSQSY